jgi:hypothetical protein
MFSPFKNVHTHEKYLQLKKIRFLLPFPLQNHTNQSFKLWENYLQMHVLLSYFPFYSKNNTLTQTKLLSSYFFLSSFFIYFSNFNLSLVAMKKPHALLHASKPPLLVSKNVPSPSLLPFFVSNHFAKKI